MNRLFIVGRGKSLEKVDLSLLDDEFTIALNGAFLLFNAKAVFFLDKTFLEVYKKEIEAFNGIVYAGQKTKWSGDTLTYTGGKAKLSGLASIDLALKIADNIFLLGYDMHPTDGINPYAYGYDQVESMYGLNGWLKSRIGLFDKFYKKYDDRIFNCNPESAIKTFKYVPLEDALTNNFCPVAMQ